MSVVCVVTTLLIEGELLEVEGNSDILLNAESLRDHVTC